MQNRRKTFELNRTSKQACYATLNDINKKWGTKTWDTWASPDKEKFMHVHIHKNYLNNVTRHLLIGLCVGMFDQFLPRRL